MWGFVCATGCLATRAAYAARASRPGRSQAEGPRSSQIDRNRVSHHSRLPQALLGPLIIWWHPGQSWHRLPSVLSTVQEKDVVNPCTSMPVKLLSSFGCRGFAYSDHGSCGARDHSWDAVSGSSACAGAGSKRHLLLAGRDDGAKGRQ